MIPPQNANFKDLTPMYVQDMIPAILPSLLEKEKQVKFAYLFGSRARGQSGPLSDTDIAVYLGRRVGQAGYRLKLMELIGKSLKSDRVDVVVLNEAPPLLRHEIIKYGRILKEDAGRRIPFEADVIRDFLDTAHLREIQRTALVENVKKELRLVRKDLIAARLEKLRSYLRTLKAIRKFDVDSFKKDVFVHATAERYLHLSIECLLDIGGHIISDRGYRKPETYGEIFDILAEEEVISPALSQELEGMSAFRNILVHDYFRLDLDQVHQILRSRIRTIENLAKVYAALLE